MDGPNSSSAAILMKQYRELTNPKKAIPSFHISLVDDDIYHWNIGVMILSEDSPYHGGYFKAQMDFPYDYPYAPPKFRFTPSIFHPNVYRDGHICISILHRSGDPASGEPDGETWSPAQSVESVLISIVSLLSDPNINSPANVDAAVAWRKDREHYDRQVARDVEASRKNIPPEFEMPKEQYAYVAPQPDSKEEVVDEDFWYESEASDEDNYDSEDDFTS
ncbi:Ubiquitin-conjugating enzyme E2 [Wickerhamiella sorbophila]|uniref:Ubiquitin-conjugating enzyme E2 n=1 Tax=Wickerhamiella sorbophila TaxID=45607 RepID=A0A2T0FJI1_9ASCO|nr:Ubiquitin-conjugating enzyme E2 [Wickerhamiella sorbophila]PRT55138.1 Ubiquitin-conjugating enzyme E2 [Wickerhamiella sorbophila]